MKFILQVLSISILLFVSYNLTLLVFPKIQNHSLAQHWWQENKIKAEHFYYHKKAYDLIIVGTSMSEGIKLEEPNLKALTLNFIGGSSLTGLELIKRSKKLPKILIVETNWLERPVYEDLVDAATNPNFNKATIVLPSLLESNQPVNVLAALIHIRPTSSDAAKVKGHFSENLTQNIQAEKVAIDTTNVEENVKKASALINYFKNNGVKVYLMELPTDQQLYTASRSSVTRFAVHKYLKGINSIPKYTAGPLETADGYHFTSGSKKSYIKHLTNFLRK